MEDESHDGVCGRAHEVPEDAVKRLSDLPAGAFEIPDEVICALEEGHPGEHMSLLQAWGESSEWLIWLTPTTLERPGCRAEGMTCLLPVDHPGRHRVIMTDVVADEGPFWCADRKEFDALRGAVS